ncbi:MAG: glutamine amidotransferase [Rhodobacteraceae bacterium]|nr:glutamine amidotransferase [Paracoccaceae bacterium]
MCGIVGLFLKREDTRSELGRLFSPMLVEMTSRGPDSAGVAVYRNPSPAECWKLTSFNPDPGFDWDRVAARLSEELQAETVAEPNDTHCVILCDGDPASAVEVIEQSDCTQVMSVGRLVEIYKETGLPRDVVERFGLESMRGSHAVGHTRMATESAVTTAGSHPFSTGPDICLVHNGSLSNHNRLREMLERTQGMRFRTENDTEVAAAYVTHRLQMGRSLHAAFEDCIDALDGFYTFVAATAGGFAVLRDPIACKPALLAETEEYVAFGSEYRALAGLPGIGNAEVWEPEPALVYSWGID